MSGEHDTPIGTPVVIAPGKVFLVGEYAVLDEGCAILAAITRHAKAQFIPRMDTMPPMVSELVKRAKTELGEAAAALPPGAVLVNSDDFRLGCAAGGLGSSAAIAVATVGAVYESLGLSIEEHRQRIFAIADAGRRTAQGDVGSGADTATSTHGGLIQITRHKDTLPRIDCLAPPAGLYLVLFSAGRSISSRQMTSGLREHARHEPAAFEHAMDTLREIAQRFVAEVNAGHATGAVVAAGRYGDELAKLSVAAAVPIVTDAFARASNLAREFGGIAKPIGAGGGEIGLAMFATPEGAQRFRKACTDPLTLLEGDLEPSGVRCRDSEKTAEESIEMEEAVVAASPEPVVFEHATLHGLSRIVMEAEEVGTVPERKMAKSAAERIGQPRVRKRRRRIILAAAIVLAVVVTWYAFPRTDGTRGRDTPNPPGTGEGSSSLAAIPETAAPPAEGAANAEGAGKPADAKPAQVPPAEPGRTTPTHAHSHRSESNRHTHAAPARGTAGGSAADAPARSPKSSRRAGNLSADDF
jgi:mevalonate kinase